MAYGGAQGVYGIDPDLTVLGKIIGGGLPVAAYGGKRHIMERVAPLGPVYQAGTLSGNPLAMRAGLATLPKLEAPGFYEGVNRKTNRLAEGLRAALREAGCRGPSERRGFVADIILLRAAGAQLRRREEIRHRSALRSFSRKCWSAEFFCRLRNTKRYSFLLRIRTRILTARSPQRARASQLSSSSPGGKAGKDFVISRVRYALPHRPSSRISPVPAA